MEKDKGNVKNGKPERAHTLVELLLFLAEKPDGVRLRKEIVGYRKRVAYVKQKRLLSKNVMANLEAKEKQKRDVESTGLGIIEKSIALLKREGYIDAITAPAKGFPKPAYKLRVRNIFDLGKLFSLIYSSDLKSSNAFVRTQEFIKSPFFLYAFSNHVLEMIYYFCLWDEFKYPIKAESYRKMISTEDNIQSKLPLSSMNINRYGMPREFQSPFRVIPGRDDYQNSPAFFREHFPNEGPAKYENFLKERGFNKFLFIWLVSNKSPRKIISFSKPVYDLESFDTFFKFLDKYSEPVKKGSGIRIDQLDNWFDKFWYGNLASLLNQYLFEPNNKRALRRKVCLLGEGRRKRGLHDFENFIPLLIGNMLNDPETAAEYLKDYIPKAHRWSTFKFFERSNVFPERCPVKDEKFNRSWIKMTEEGKKFVVSVARSMSGQIRFPNGLLELFKQSLGFHLEIMPLPSLDLCPGYIPEMTFSSHRLSLLIDGYL